MRGDDDGPAVADAILDDAALDDGKFFIRNFDSQIATGHHDGVGGFDEFGEIFDGSLVFDLGDDTGIASAVFVKDFAEFLDVLGFPDKGESDEIHAEFDAEPNVAPVFLGDGGHGDVDTGEVDVAAAAERAFGEDFALDAAVEFFEDFEFDDAVVEQDDVAVVDVVDEVGVVDVHGFFFLALRAFDGEFEDIAGFEVERHGEIAGADGGALRVHHDRTRPPDLPGRIADAAGHRARPVVRGVAHVETEHIHAGGDEFGQHFGGLGAGANGRDDFGSSHGVAVYWRDGESESLVCRGVGSEIYME